RTPSGPPSGAWLVGHFYLGRAAEEASRPTVLAHRPDATFTAGTPSSSLSPGGLGPDEPGQSSRGKESPQAFAGRRSHHRAQEATSWAQIADDLAQEERSPWCAAVKSASAGAWLAGPPAAAEPSRAPEAGAPPRRWT